MAISVAINMEDLQRQLMELAQRMEAMQGEVVNLRGENAQLRQVRDVSWEALQRLPDLVLAVQEQSAQMTRRQRRTLVDNKGIGKPNVFKNVEKEFVHWARKVELYITGVYPEMEVVLNWATDSQERVTRAMVLAQFGDEADDLDIVADVQNLNTQVYSCLYALTEGESADVVAAVEKGNGVEAWRALHRRWDPSVAGRSRAILREVISPKRSSLDNVLANLVIWEEQVRRYEQRKDKEGNRQKVPDDIRMSSVEALVPEELEKHLLLNSQRLSTYALMRDEVVMYAEARTGQSLSGRLKKDPNTMDIDALTQEKGKAKGKGKKGKGKGKDGGPKSDVSKIECWNCGKKGHRQADCYTKKKYDKKGDGAKANGKGKGQGANALEIVQEMSSTALDLCSVSRAEGQGGDTLQWAKINLDTGAACTAWPLDFAPKTRAEVADTSMRFKTATGEKIDANYVKKVLAIDERGRKRRMHGRVAPVHKPLASAGSVCDAGADVYLGKEGGYIVGGKFMENLRKAFDEIAAEEAYADLTPVYREDGVYNFYVQVQSLTLDISAGDTVAQEENPLRGGSRQAPQP